MVKVMSVSITKEMELKKTITQLLISVSIFSLVFSWCSPTLLHNQNLHYFSCNSFHLVSFTMNKNCVFLFCNAILVFLANTSPFHRPPPPSDPDGMLQMRISDGLPLQTEAEVLLLSDKHESSVSSEDDDNDDGAEEMKVVYRELKQCSADEVLICIDDQKDDAGRVNEGQDCWLFDTDVDDRDREEEDGDEDDEIEKLSCEELNQKFEDFIRRMKEEFKVNEYQKQQLVIV